MARWLLFLVFALTAQFVSAAVATYCGHETAPASFHIGHHVHQHRADQPEAGHAEAASDSVALEHVDCSYCHASVAQVGSVQGTSFGTFHSRPFVGIPPKPLISTLEAEIERPKWARAS